MLRARRLCSPYLGTDSVQATLILLGGVWAMVPDVYWITSGYTEPIQAIHDTALANLFWPHRILDVLDLRDTSIGATLAVGLWISFTITVEVVGTLRKPWVERKQGNSLLL